jgi:hypothetical protein
MAAAGSPWSELIATSRGFRAYIGGPDVGRMVDYGLQKIARPCSVDHAVVEG